MANVTFFATKQTDRQTDGAKTEGKGHKKQNYIVPLAVMPSMLTPRFTRKVKQVLMFST